MQKAKIWLFFNCMMTNSPPFPGIISHSWGKVIRLVVSSFTTKYCNNGTDSRVDNWKQNLVLIFCLKSNFNVQVINLKVKLNVDIGYH